tara:strand:+ start:341 stop:478 length:138 start_codon:yes stop_codon:yes gene_type:complete
MYIPERGWKKATGKYNFLTDVHRFSYGRMTKAFLHSLHKQMDEIS